MGIGMDVVESLRQLGHDALHLLEQGLQRMPDDEILAKAATEERILLAHDLDFGRLLALSGAVKPSVVTFRLNDMRPANVIKRLLIVMREYAVELHAGAAISVTDAAQRCRMLPIDGPAGLSSAT